MFDISLHLLDLAENSIKAGAGRVKISLKESARKNRLILRIIDDGCGMSPEKLKNVTSPFFTTRTERTIGLGISLMNQTCQETGGWLRFKSREGVGTALEAVMGLNHIDRLPLGELEKTIITLLVGNQEIKLGFRFAVDDKSFAFSSEEIRDLLGDVPVSSPEGIKAIRSLLKQEFNALKVKAET